MRHEEFIRRYCLVRQRQVRTRSGAARTIEQVVGANPATTPVLARAIAPFWHRPPAAEIERDLPPLRLVIRHLPTESVDADAIAELEDSQEAVQLRAAIAAGDLREVEGNVARLRRLLALAKVDATAAWVEGALDEGEPKVLAWGWHVQALEELRNRLLRHRPVMITGDTPQKARDAAVAAFQGDPAVRIFVGQIQAAGQAVTLTAGRRAVFLEQAFVPSLNWQALKRCHRIGQHRPVLGEVLVVPDSIDQAVQELLARKADIAILEAIAA
jgi:SWI/SNF-related matrix-associated actin-dependent regulator of chromatin subfamily A-like protein 1